MFMIFIARSSALVLLHLGTTTTHCTDHPPARKQHWIASTDVHKCVKVSYALLAQQVHSSSPCLALISAQKPCAVSFMTWVFVADQLL